MQLLKKIGFYAFVVISIATAIWGYFKLKENKESSSSVLEHIPNNAVFIFETKNIANSINQLTRQNLIWSGLVNESIFEETNTLVQYFDSILKLNQNVSEIMTDNAVYVSFFKEKERYQNLIQFKCKEKNNQALFEEFFTSTFKTKSTETNQDFYEINLKQKKWFITIKDGIVYLANEKNISLKAMDLLKTESIALNTNYNELQKLNGEQPNFIYVNHALAQFFPTALFKQQSIITNEIKLNELNFSGYTSADSSLAFIKNQQPTELNLYEHLPQNPQYLVGFSITDANAFYKNCMSNEVNDKLWKSINDSALYDMKQEFLDNINEQLALSNYENDGSNLTLLSISIKDINKAKQFINIITDSTFTQPEVIYSQINSSYKKLFALFNLKQEFNYACVNANELIFSSNKTAALLYNYALINSKFIEKDEQMMEYARNNFRYNCNLFCFENKMLHHKQEPYFLFNTKDYLKENKSITHISYTIKNFKNTFQTRINLTNAKQVESNQDNFANALWSFDADSSIISGVNVFTNHTNQENELCFQDNAKRLYLISTTGNLIWKKNLTEKITSPIYTVDIFKNGKLQLLFNTENYLHLIDRNGNYVQGYPLKTPAKITSPITLLDYDNNKDYRLFIACDDKKIYNYSIYGIKTEGFIPVKTENVVKLPIHYIKVGASDYLITADEQGKIYGFSRKGEGRIDFKNKTIVELNHLFVLKGNSLANTKLIYVDDKNNLLNKISLTDKKETLKLGDELVNCTTSFDMVNDDNQTDALVYGDGALYAYDLFSSKLMEHFNKNVVFDNVQSIATSSQNYILAHDKVGQKLYLLSSEGKLINVIANVTEKPLISNLYKNGKTYLLLVYNKSIRCQELN